MFFFFPNDGNNSESESNDLDVFLYDDRKLIHFATAGVNPTRTSLETPLFRDQTLKNVLKYRRNFDYEINPKIERSNLLDIENYTSFFELMSKRGFYSYDRVFIDRPDSYTFELISRPLYDKRIVIDNSREVGALSESRIARYNLQLVKAKRDFPENFIRFDIRKYV